MSSPEALDFARRFWEQKDLPRWFEGRSRILLALSGGADSMALLWLLRASNRPEWSPQVVAGHIHHGLRGKEADADLRIASDLAKQLDTPFRFRKLDPEKIRADSQGSLEDALRRARYAALREMGHRCEAQAIVLAHHRDDLAETFLMRLLRGSGLTGLAAFGPVADLNGLNLIRPLLDWPRDDIRKAACAAGIDWREDASNLDPAFLRNRVRHRILPWLENETGHGPVAQTLARTARRLERDARALNRHVENLYQQSRLLREKPLRIGLPQKILRDDDGLFAPYLLRRLVMESSQTPYPPDEARTLELDEFSNSAHPGSLLQTARNVVVWLDNHGVLWAYQKPRRRMSRPELVQIFQRP
ncbi:tRNA lysidine(34) synthetase TilS [bacterium]|nr:tRNA lysidine(34) synthetase TilS [bacterium]